MPEWQIKVFVGLTSAFIQGVPPWKGGCVVETVHYALIFPIQNSYIGISITLIFLGQGADANTEVSVMQLVNNVPRELILH